MKSLDQRWREKVVVSPDGCHLFTGSTTGKGYGQIWKDGKPQRAHRVIYEEIYGPIPVGKLVCHKCDVRNCVNPEHLYLGTQKENMQDMYASGYVRSERGNAKISTALRGIRRSEETRAKLRAAWVRRKAQVDYGRL